MNEWGWCWCGPTVGVGVRAITPGVQMCLRGEGAVAPTAVVRWPPGRLLLLARQLWLLSFALRH